MHSGSEFCINRRGNRPTTPHLHDTCGLHTRDGQKKPRTSREPIIVLDDDHDKVTASALDETRAVVDDESPGAKGAFRSSTAIYTYKHGLEIVYSRVGLEIAGRVYAVTMGRRMISAKP